MKQSIVEKRSIPNSYYKRRRIAKTVWVYTALLLIVTLALGTFAIAFMASLKDDALSEPTNFNFGQVRPSNWLGATKLGLAGNQAPMFGGFAPGADISFELTYAIPDHESFVTPVIKIPKRRPGTGMAAALTTDYAADYALVSTPVLVTQQQNVSYTLKLGTKKQQIKGKSATWQFSVKYKGDGPIIAALPLDITTPRTQMLINSTLDPSRFERRGRVASWVNISPGLIGYVFRSYVRVWNESVSLETGQSMFLSWTINSFFIALAKVLLTVIIACTAGYAMARMSFAGARSLFLLMIFSMTVPAQVTFISNYEIFNALGILNTPWAVITMLIASGQVLIMKQFFEKFPRELEDAAVVDGASPLAILTHVFLPLSKPALASIIILGFQGSWNDFFWPMVVLTSPADVYTLPVGLLSLRNAYGVTGDWSLILAGSFLTTIPVLVVFIIFQRHFTGNNIGTAVKG